MARIIIIKEDIKQEIAEKVALQAGAGYMKDFHGEWFVVDGTEVVHRASNAPWNPWHDGADVISVEDLVFEFGGAEQEGADFKNGVGRADDFDVTVAFASGYVPDSYDADAWDRRRASLGA